ncbi:TadE/TadG family type IV pilus assembly protein [Streptomyces sp. NPDC050658]|uniref:TadE/TadG family type IV pilus assembly protein n=1 Tax=unclassified Streptomyces TaxID=2593676 RepID=UPI0034120B44
MSARWRHCSDIGSVTMELVLLIPLLITMLWLLLFCGRLADTRIRIEDAAHQAARAASAERSTSAAAAEARATAASALSDAGIICRSLDVETNGSMRPGGTMTATVSCSVDLHDLALLQVPGETTLKAEFAAPVDEYRGTTTMARGGGAR